MLFGLFREYLLASGVPEKNIILLALDDDTGEQYRDPYRLSAYVRELASDPAQKYYVFIDEIQFAISREELRQKDQPVRLYSVLNGFLRLQNIDVYVTGSNSRFLSTDIITEFRGRGDQIHMTPLSFSEFFSAYGGDKYDCWNEYITYGGMPLVLAQKTDKDKAAYLKDLFAETYFKDIIERNHIKRVDVLDSIVDILASSVGSLTNPRKIYDTFKSKGEKELSINTINSYLSFLEDAFIIKKAIRYDVKGRKYINTPFKYYFADVGLRNARINCRQQEDNHLMENVIYNELLLRGFNVDVGVVEIREGNKRTQTEVDFICNEGSNRYYIQSALNLSTSEKTAQESRSLNHISDNFKKIIIVKDNVKPWRTEDGILVIGIIDFLIDPDSLDR